MLVNIPPLPDGAMLDYQWGGVGWGANGRAGVVGGWGVGRGGGGGGGLLGRHCKL